METLQPQLRFPEFKDLLISKTIGDVCNLTTGNKDTQNKIYDGTYPFFVRSQTIERINSYSYDGEAILTSGDGVGVGKNYHYINGKFDFHQRVYCLNKFKDDIYGKFVFHYFSENFLRRITRMNAKNSVDSVRREMIFDMPIFMPSFLEQTRIANFLSSVDEKLNLLKTKKSLLEEYKKGMMQKIFNQEIRFKDDNGQYFEEWEEKKLGQVSIKESSNISANKIEENFGDYIIYGASGVLKSVDFYLQESDYISIIKDGAGVGRIFYCEGKTSVLGTMEMIKPNKEIDTYFLYCLLDNIDFTSFITGSTIPHIYYKDYSKVKCGIPCMQEQTKIANFLSAIDEKIKLVSIQIQDTQEYKKGLLQQLFV